jgi:hypothetical protein
MSLDDNDILIAADVVYDVGAIPALVTVARKFLEGGKDRTAYFATTMRNERTFDLFINCLESEGVVYEELKGFDYEELFDTFWTQKREEIRLHTFSLS